MNKPTLLLKSILLFLFLINSTEYLSAQTYVGTASTPSDNSAQAGPTVTVNPASVGTMQAGDLVIIYAHYRDNTGTLSVLEAGGQNWLLATSSANNLQSMAIFWCRFNGTWSANPSVTVGTGTNGMSAFMYVFRPTNSSNGWLVNNTTGVQTTNNTTVQVTAHSTTRNNAVSVAFWSSPSNNTYGSLTAGWTKPGSTQYRNTQASSNQSHSAAYKIMATAGGTGNVTQVLNTTQQTKECMISWAEGPTPSNDDCVSATELTPTGICSATAGNLFYSTISNPTGTGCTNRSDVWYKFTLPSTPEATFATIMVSLTSSPSTLTTTNTYIELFNANACPVSSPIGACNNISSPRSYMGLTPGATYYFRINTSATPNVNSTQWGFNVCVTTFQPTTVGSGRMNEVFRQTVLSPPEVLLDPWEITYGPDDKLWITESKGYKVYRMDPSSGAKTTVLDISQGSTFLSDNSFNCQFANGNGAQGGLAGLALHPKFLDPVAPENYVYVSYVHSQSSSTNFTNRIVRFTFNTGTGLLESPVSVCDTLPGSNDHNSQRMLIAPVVKGGTPYLFYASGDMGAGQFSNANRTIKSQFPNSYEGKILRFNLVSDGQAGLDGWIPNDNPYNTILGVQSAVWSIGIRNNQGFALDTSLNILYGSSHGPYSDDEINIIEPFKNYGHPMVIGYASDGNYNGETTAGSRIAVSAGAPYPTNNGISSIAPIGDEMSQKALIDAGSYGSYKDPLFSAYAAVNGDTLTPGTIKYIWRFAPNNASPAPGWPSEGWSGLDLYNNSVIPGWKKSLVAASLKWGRLVRIKLGSSGTITMPSNHPTNNAGDTISYFGGQNRFRDLAFAPNGKDIYVVMDRSTTSSGPSSAFPVVPSCKGCVQKYTFLGYNVNTGSSNRSYIPTTISVAPGKASVFETANKVVINAANDNTNIWVPITDTSSNIIAEINAQGYDLDTVTTSVYTRIGASRIRNGKKYMNRNITITPKSQPGGAVLVRLYISKQEYDDFVADGYAGSIGAIKILKNTDSCLTSITAMPETINPVVAEAFGTDNGYVLQASINSFSSFYFSNETITLPTDVLTFKGLLQNNVTHLQWETAGEINSSHFIIERSTDGTNFNDIGKVAAAGSSVNRQGYSFTDNDVINLSSGIVHYRLRIVDTDGQFKYSSIVVVYLSDIVGKIVLSPNPAGDETRVSFKATLNGRAQWKLMDNNGRVISQSAIHINKGNNNFTIKLNGLPAGIYYLNLSGAGLEQNLKLQKL